MRLNPGSCIIKVLATARSAWLLLILLVCLAVPVAAQQGSVRSELSSSSITRDESVTLTIIAEGVDGELDISALDKDFEVVGRSSSRQISTVTGANGQPSMTSVVSWALELLPRDVGVFTVPAVSVGGVPSQLLSLTVNELPVGARRDIFIEATVDTRTPWVQSQVMMTLRVFQAVEIVDGGLSEPAGEHLEVQRIGEDTRSTETRDGRQYSVTERRFALFPQQSGSLVVEPVTLNVSVPADPTRVRGFFSPTRKLTRRTDAITLDVQPRPSSGATWWLPASAVVLDAQWAGGNPVAAVDQPMTRSVVLRAAGVMDSQLPDISIPAIDGVSLYAEEPVRAMGIDERGLVAEQTVKWALIPQRAGALVLPEVRVEWFNTTTGNVETAVLPEEVIQVAPAEAAMRRPSSGIPGAVEPGTVVGGAAANDGMTASNTAPAEGLPESVDEPGSSVEALSARALPSASGSASASNTMSSVAGVPPEPGAGVQDGTLSMDTVLSIQASADTWRSVALASLGLWLLSLGWLVWHRRRNHAAPLSRRGQAGDSPRHLDAVRQRVGEAVQTLAPLAAVSSACTGTDPSALRTALLEWAARQWISDPPLTLSAVSSRLAEGEARNLLMKLDAALYSREHGDSSTQTLMASLSELPRLLSEAIRGDDESPGNRGNDSSSENESNRRGGLPAL